jgi:DNA-directed RNA polymerase specialized sigma subunit
MDPTEEQLEICADLGRSATESLAIIRQVFGEESISYTQKVQTHGDLKILIGQEQIQEHTHNFL